MPKRISVPVDFGRSRKPRGRAAYIRRRLMRRRPFRRIAQPVQYFKRTTYTTNWLATNTGLDMFKNLTIKLDDVPAHTEFTNLYDQYKIAKVVATLIPKFNSVDPLNPSSIVVPPTWSVLDYDGTFPTTENAMLQYQNLHQIPGMRWHKRVFRPRFLTEQYNGLTTAYSPKTGFIDCNYASVPHYGATFMSLPTGGEAVYGYDLKVVYYLAFKNVR